MTSVRLAAPDGGALPAALPGQFLTLRLPASGGRRWCAATRCPGHRRRRLPDQRQARTGRRRQRVPPRPVRAGDRSTPPRPAARSSSRRPRRSLLVSAGIGVTPVLAMLHALAATARAATVWWLHGARDGAEHAFAAEAARCSRRGRGTVICYSRPRPEDRPGSDYDVPAASTRRVGGLGLPADADAYVCGPAGFMDDVTAALARPGSPGRVHTELFGAGAASTPGMSRRPQRPRPPPGPPGAGPARSRSRAAALTVGWTDGYGSLLDLAEACDVPVRWSCRTGVCHTCETGLLSGDVELGPSRWTRRRGQRPDLLRPARTDLVLDL